MKIEKKLILVHVFVALNFSWLYLDLPILSSMYYPKDVVCSSNIIHV